MSYRKIVINNEEWSYKIGKSFSVIKHPKHGRFNVSLEELTCISCYEIERGQHKHNFSVTPSEIRNFILTREYRHLYSESDCGRFISAVLRGIA